MPINFTEAGNITPSEAAEYIKEALQNYGNMLDKEVIEVYSLAASVLRKYPIIHSAAQRAAYDLAPNLHGERNIEAARQILSEALKACEL